MSELSFVVDNLIGVYNTGIELDLPKIAQSISKAVYNPSKFAAVVVKSLVLKSTGLLFKSGKIVVSGCKTEADLKKSADLIKKILRHVGVQNIRDEDIKLRSMCGHFVFPERLSLESFYYSHIQESTYEPELFPGLIYRLQNPSIVYTIYVSGKVVINGAKSRQEINKAIDVIFEELSLCRRSNLIENV
jgi:transcription initiation factor TFIID TATA-box-binding protein